MIEIIILLFDQQMHKRHFRKYECNA